MRLTRCITALVGAAAAAALGAAEPIFRHSGFAPLSRGEFGNAGQNVFVSARGELKLINWFDLDRDGFPEIIVNNDHSTYENADSLIYFQHPVDGFRSLLPAGDEAGAFERIAWMRGGAGRVELLPSMGGGRSVIADLDGDGRPEIIFANFFHGSTHDHFPVFVYWGTEAGYSLRRRSEFPSESATGVAVADLDGNGRPDLVVANMGHEDDTTFASAGPIAAAAPPVESGATARARIYWQGEDGFALERVTDLPTRHAVDVKIADLNGDGRPDLVFLQGGDWPSLRIFYGAPDGFPVQRMAERPIRGRGWVDGVAGELALADLDGDGRIDVAVAAGGTELEVFFNRGDAIAAWPRLSLPANTALSVVAADLNGDGRPDLAVTGLRAKPRTGHRTEAFVYWNGSDGFSAPRRTALPVLGGTTVRAADINRDGFVDLVFANSQDDATFDVPSFIYWGGRSGFASERRTELTGFGAVSVAIGDLNHDGLPDLFLANRNSGRSEGPIDSFVYWGNAARAFSGAAQTKIPLTTGFSSSAGDIFDDGRGAIAFTESAGIAVAHLAADRTVAEIRRFALPSRGFTTTLADLDRDGRLDLIVGLIEADGRNLAILRGVEGGFGPAEFYRPGLPIIASAVADLDGDGKLDLVLGGRGGWLFCPLDATGRPDLGRATRIPSDFQIQRLTVADLNGDGAPDVIATHYREMTHRRNAIDSAIYWNRRGRFSLAERTPLPTYGGHWVSVADLTGRGSLDVLYSNYHGETTRIVGLFVYPADAQGSYGVGNRFVLPALSSSAHYVADLDGDGFPDIVAFNHTGPNQQIGLQPKSGIHGVGSYVYWGSANGFDRDRRSTIESHGPHKTVNAELGDILRRRPFETYCSPWTEAAVGAGEYELRLAGTFVGRTSCGVQVQTADGGEWTELPPNPAASTAREKSFRLVVKVPITRLRYRLELRTGGAGTGPTVTAIELRPP